MTRRVILIHHPVGKRDDRAAQMLQARGCEIEWFCPGKGDALPAENGRYAAAVVYGGAENLSEAGADSYLHGEIEWIKRWVEGERPLLGICLGAQLLARAFGGKVEPHPEGQHEIGYYPIRPTDAAGGFLTEEMHVYHWHGEGFEPPPGSELLASGETFPNQAFRYGVRAFGIQFHPEVSPEVFQRWIREAGHMLASPGAHPAERQVADGARYDATMRVWLETFLDRWLEDA